MKKIISILFLVVLMSSVIIAQNIDTNDFDMAYYTKLKDQNVSLNVYNWGEYIADGYDSEIDINKEFENITGIKVNYTTYASNEEMYIKLKIGGVNYDIIIPSDYTTAKLIADGLIQKLDYNEIPNYTNTLESFMNPIYDPNSLYSVPYAWGLTGIIYNTTMVDEKPEDISWDILFNEKYKGNILMYSNPRDAFGVALSKLGYSLNTTNESEINEAATLLKKQKSIVQAYVMDQIYDKMESGEAAIGVYYAGDSLTMINNNPDLNFVIPKKGANLYVDSVAIPTSAENVLAAHMYINFLLEPVIALDNINYIQYSSPNKAAIALMDEEKRNHPIIYPSDEIISNAEVFLMLPEETTIFMSDLWNEIITTDETYAGWVVPMLLASAAVGVFVIIRLSKKKKRNSSRK